MENNKQYQLNVSTSKEGTLEIINRSGEAKEIQNIKRISNVIEGDIFAPGEWFGKKKIMELDVWKNEELFSFYEHSHVISDKDNDTITLVVNDVTDEFEDKIIGRIKQHEDFASLKINTRQTFTNRELRDKLRMMRMYFHDLEEHKNLITNLSAFYAKLDQEIKDEDDDKGNITHNYQAQLKLKDEFPLFFTLNMPVWKGLPKQKFRVDINFTITNRQVEIWLESIDLKDVEIKQKDEIFKKALAPFEQLSIINV